MKKKKYYTVGTVPKYYTVGTVPKFHRKIDTCKHTNT
jgi:hypothetical protein